jgi:hypothetical protein
MQIAKTGNVQLIIYDIIGREIKTVIDKTFKLGNYEVEFNGSDLASGIYFYKMITNEYNETRRMVLIK